MTSTRTRIAALLVALTAGAAHGQEMDPTQFVQAPGKVPLGADVKVGWMAERTTQAGGQTMVESYAVVGEEGDSWRVESSSPVISAMAASFPQLEGSLLALTVRKSDGVVTKAVLQKPGEAGKPVKVSEAPDMTPPTEGEGTAEEVTVGAGTFASKKYSNEGTTAWVGTDGDTKGVLLKVAGEGQEFELDAAPKKATVDVGGTQVSTTETSYTNGMKMTVTDHPVIAGIFGSGLKADEKPVGLFSMEMEGMSMTVTRVATDASARLTWE